MKQKRGQSKRRPTSAGSSIAEVEGSTTRTDFYQSVVEVVRTARSHAFRAINFVMVEAYWRIGRMIVEEEQVGKERAGYGEQLMNTLSRRLTEEFGKGFAETNLKYFRQFYLTYPAQSTEEIRHTLCDELTWSHYRLLMRVEKAGAREWYMNEAASQNWSVRALQRQINSLYYERLLMSRDKAPVAEEMQEKTAPLAPAAGDFIKDPYVLEFLGIPDAYQFREAELERAIIGKLQAFMLELGKGFAFVGRQHRISTESKDFFIDLVFYNYILKCFLLIDLKTSELTHEDIGKMDMYVRLFEDTVKGADDNPTVGLILCTDTDHTVVKYSVLNESRQLFASKYSLYLPSEEELRIEIERERALAVREQYAMYDVKGRIQGKYAGMNTSSDTFATRKAEEIEPEDRLRR
jgi:predicted nuclease of restriction endonuclease-like (RecB) superfamily